MWQRYLDLLPGFKHNPIYPTDKIHYGDPGKEVRSILVAWIPSFDVIRHAVEHGFDMIVVHEAAMYGRVERPLPEFTAVAEEKRKFIEAHGLVIARMHSIWDRVPEVGIAASWANFLGFPVKPVAQEEHGLTRRYDIEPVRFEEFARRIARRTAALGEPLVETVGDPNKIVSRVGLGCGAISDITKMRELGCDVFIVTDDGARYFGKIQMAADEGLPVICVNHGTAEEPGVANLAVWLRETFKGVKVEHYAQGCRFRHVGDRPEAP